MVVWGLSGAERWEFRRVLRRSPAAASRIRPSLPSVCMKKMGICNSATWSVASIGNGVRSPQDLGNHTSDTPEDTTVKHPRVLIRKVDDERTAVCPNAIGGIYGIALQNAREVPLSPLGTETIGYVPVH